MDKFDLTNIRISQEVGLIPFVAGSVAAILEFDDNSLHAPGVNAADMTFSVIVYPESQVLTCQYTLWKETGEEHFRYESTRSEEQHLWGLLETFSQENYGCTLQGFPAWFQDHAMSTCGVKQ